MLILYIFNADVASAYGITNANPQFGKGGLPQYYVPDVQDLICLLYTSDAADE